MLPAVLLQDVSAPRLAGKTNAHLAAWCIELLAALELSNRDKQALRDWAEVMNNSD